MIIPIEKLSWGNVMHMRVFTAAVVCLAVYLAFGDFIHGSRLSAPENFVGDVGRGIGTVISGAATTVIAAIGI
ncbi:hypothetical protein GQ651_12590 [Alphaproteobacteria bacterium GH1-50]|uniref:Uncharacterized protein n=1 Tax=Kangsaoukella pontilimi TaxID=2691042 RepID=A0A7C9ISK5_9RHOB|nr:hypothetical protein [Kangsaoukella pontilimi]MXQ08686.1 hypothetical protein [Kangsaoukella pontilimi]